MCQLMMKQYIVTLTFLQLPVRFFHRQKHSGGIFVGGRHDRHILFCRLHVSQALTIQKNHCPVRNEFPGV